MSTTLQLRRGTTAEIAGTLGAEGEVFVNTETGQLVVMDGVTLGGTTLATMSDVVSGNTIQGVANFTSATTMAQANLTAGTVVTTSGYYTANDGGHGTYIIVPRADYPNQNPDTYIDLELPGFMVAVLIGETIYIEQAGIIGDSPLNGARMRAALLKERSIRARKSNTNITWPTHITVKNINVDLDLNNNTLVIPNDASHDGFIWFQQDFGTPRSVLGTAGVTGTPIGKTIITVDDATGIFEHDIIKIYANDVLNARNPGYNDVTLKAERVAEFLQVESVNGNEITVRSQLIFDYTDNPRIAVMGNKNLQLRNCKIYRENDGIENNYSIAFMIRGYHHSTVENMYTTSWGAQFINHDNGYFNTFRDIHAHHLVNRPEQLRLGYVLAEYGCQLSQVYNLNGGNTRHTWTSGAGDCPYDHAKPELYGGCVRCHIWSGTATGNNGYGFDTHADSYECEFHDIVVYDSITDTVNATGGVQLRGINHIIHKMTYSGHGDNSGNAILLTGATHNAQIGTIYHNSDDAAIAMYSEDYTTQPGGEIYVDHIVVQSQKFRNILKANGVCKMRVHRIDMSLKDVTDTTGIADSSTHSPVYVKDGADVKIDNWNVWFDSKFTTERPQWPKIQYFFVNGNTDINIEATINVHTTWPLWQFSMYDAILCRGFDPNNTFAASGHVNINYHYDDFNEASTAVFRTNQLHDMDASTELSVSANIFKKGKRIWSTVYDKSNSDPAAMVWDKYDSTGQYKLVADGAITPTSPGKPGETRVDTNGNYLYKCIADNTWVRYPMQQSW